MSRLSYQRPVDPKFTGPKAPCPELYHGWGNVKGYHNKCHQKPKTIIELQETMQMIWDKAVKSPERDHRLALKLKIDTSNILGDCGILTFCRCHLNYVIYGLLGRTFSSA